jgi:hypothetical protein
LKPSDEDMAYFWSDGCYAAKRYHDNYLKDQITAMEKAKADRIQKEIERRVYQSQLDRNEGHPGIACCNSCYGEYIDNYMGGGVMMDGYCCCRDYRIRGVVYPLDDPQYRPMYPPVDGKVPEVFNNWGPKTQERYLKRLEKELTNETRNSA